MTRTLASPRHRPSPRRGPPGPVAGARGRTARSLARAASGLVCGALADVGEMLVVSLLTAGAAAAAACALASLVFWLARALASVVVRRPARALARRRPAARPIGMGGDIAARALRPGDGRTRCSDSSDSRPANGQQLVLPSCCRNSGHALVLPRSRPRARASPVISAPGDGE